MSISYSVHCIDEAATASLVRALARTIHAFFTQTQRAHHGHPHLHVSLQGDLGAGKTTAVRYLLKELGYLGKVKSPTYSLCEEHRLVLEPNSSLSKNELQHTIDLYHFDFYRMQSTSEWLDAGLEEHFNHRERPTMCIVEWPEKALGTLPIMDMDIKIVHGQDADNELVRTICFTANTPEGEQLLASIQSCNQSAGQT